MSDQFQIIHSDETFTVELTITRKAREFVGIKNYRHEPQAATPATTVETEVESVTFTHEDKQTAIRRAIGHLKIMEDTE